MDNLKSYEKYNKTNEEYGMPPLESNLQKFINDFISNMNNTIIMSMFYRMLDSGNFVKFGKDVYSFNEEEKEKLEEIKPLFDELVAIVSKIKHISNIK